MDTLNRFLEFEIFSIGDASLQVYSILIAIIIVLATKFIIWLLQKTINRKNKFNKLDPGNSYALFQIIRYVLWLVAISFILETIGIQITVLIAGSAALLVGIGLGLQQTFNDFISGIILLIEGVTKAGDVLEIDGDVINIQEIGLRTSKGLNRDQIVVIIPNSLITANKVINWSHQSRKTRFGIDVGVAYGSDVDLVTKVLIESVMEHPEIHDKNLIEARLLDFGDSSLDFRVLFFSEDVFRVEKVKSDIRKIINKKFIENKITIPFPQLDMHLKSKSLEDGDLKK